MSDCKSASDHVLDLAMNASEAEESGNVNLAISAHGAVVMEACRIVLQARAMAGVQDTPEWRQRTYQEAVDMISLAKMSLDSLSGLVVSALNPPQPAAQAQPRLQPAPFPAIPLSSKSQGSGRTQQPRFPTIPAGQSVMSTRSCAPAPEMLPQVPAPAAQQQQQQLRGAPAFPRVAQPQGPPRNTLELLRLMPDVRIETKYADIFSSLTPEEVTRINGPVAEFERACQDAKKQLEDKRARAETVPPHKRAEFMSNLVCRRRSHLFHFTAR